MNPDIDFLIHPSERDFYIPGLSPLLPAYIDSSMLADFRACPTKFFYRYCLGLAGRAINPDLHAGACFSSSIRQFRESYFVHKFSYQRSLADAFRTMSRAWGDFIPPQKWLWGKFHDHPKDFVNMWMALEFYLQTFHPDSDTATPMPKAETGGRSPFEFSFAIPLPETTHPTSGEPFIYCGRVDMLAIYSGRGFVVDDKTSAYNMRDTEHWSRKWRMRGQFIGYVWAAQQSGMPVIGAIARGVDVQKTQFKCGEWIGEIPQWQVERWYEELIASCEALSRFWTDRRFPRDYADACSSYGGCAFLEACDSQHPEKWLPSYKQYRWDPLAADPSHTREIAARGGLEDVLLFEEGEQS